MVYIPVAEYRPDVSSVNKEFTDTIINVLPSEQSYIPVPGLMKLSTQLGERVFGAYSFRSGNIVKIIVGGSNKLYLYDSPTRSWKDISKPGTTYNADENNLWSFTVFGKYLIAVNKNDKPQYLTLPDGSTFDDLPGEPPKAGLVKIWGDFLCLMQLKEHPNRVHWSGINDATHWKVGEKSCDYQDFPDGEYVQGSTESTNPLIFMRSAIYAGAFFPGSKLIFNFNKIQDRRGAKSSESIACRGEYAFFIDDGGFYQINAGGQIAPIGFEKVDRTVFMDYDNIAIGDLSGVVDPFHNRVYWSLKSGNNEQTTFVYDWGLQRWSTFQSERLYLFPAFTTGYTLEQLDEISENLEMLPASLDNRMWQSGAPALGAFDSDGRFGLFVGKPMEATVVSQEFGETNGNMVFFRKTFADVDTLEGYLSIGQRYIRADWVALKWSKERVCSDDTGAYHCRSRSRYHRFKLRIPEGTEWKHISGFNVDFRPAGER